MDALQLRVPIEPEVKIYSDLKKPEVTINGILGLIHLNGWRCDSISNVREKMSFSTAGYKISCNYFRYSYEVVDRAGTWVACINKCKF